jgi:hypothetical protein
MRASVVLKSKDEAARLRLTLASLARQTEPAEVVVVNDGSTDGTGHVIDAAAANMRLVRIDHARTLGRSAASNAGAQAASGDIVIFLDGDTLAGPDLVARHLSLHRDHSGLIGRGETFHLRCTRLFLDPQTGAPMPGEEDRVRSMPEAELARLRVTHADIDDFGAIDCRAQPGVYPAAGPRRLYELEMGALRDYPDCPVLWAAASGSNQSVDRREFLAAGGEDLRLTINAHREVALRLCANGFRMAPVSGARTYHMTHRRGWRDPLTEPDWEEVFYRAHPIPAVALLAVLWASLADRPLVPGPARITSLPALAEAAARLVGVVGIENLREAHLAATRSSPALAAG